LATQYPLPAQFGTTLPVAEVAQSVWFACGLKVTEFCLFGGVISIFDMDVRYNEEEEFSTRVPQLEIIHGSSDLTVTEL
jgi:hypothetical protein